MAKRDIVPEAHLVCLTLTRREAVEVIALLTAQLAGEPAPGCQSGGAPEIRVVDRGVCVERIALMVENEKKA